MLTLLATLAKSLAMLTLLRILLTLELRLRSESSVGVVVREERFSLRFAITSFDPSSDRAMTFGGVLTCGNACGVSFGTFFGASFGVPKPRL
jgi:hypothetical protein